MPSKRRSEGAEKERGSKKKKSKKKQQQVVEEEEPETAMMSTTDASAALSFAEEALQAEDFEGAQSAAETALQEMEALKGMQARAAVVRGKALLAQITDKQTDPSPAELQKEAWEMFTMALELEPENAEAQAEVDKLQELPPLERPPPNHPEPLDVVVVGAGASGVGLGLMLTRVFDVDPKRVLIIERGEGVGESFRQWPKEMRFISPSFNSQGWTESFDLNSVAHGTSPAFTLHAEHPTGEQYANYLSALAERGELNVKAKTEVTAVRPFAEGEGEGFEVEVVPVCGG